MAGRDPLLPLPPNLDQLVVIGRWLELTLERVDTKIQEVREAEAEVARRRPLPEPSRWWIEYGIGIQRQPTRVHTCDCRRGTRSRSATRDMAVEVLRTTPSVIACPLCRPDRELGLLDL